MPYRKWTVTETQELLELGGTCSDAEIAIRLGRDINSIRNHRRRLRRKGTPGTGKTNSNRPPNADPEEFLALRDVLKLSGASKTQIYRASRDGRLPSRQANGQTFWRAEDVVQWRGNILQEPHRDWRDDEIEALLELAGTCTTEQIAAYIGGGRTGHAVRRKINQLGVQTGGHKYKYVPFAVSLSAILIAKTCPVCGKFLDAAYFAPHRANGSRYRDKCASCCNAKYNTEEPGAAAERARKFRAPLQNITRAAATNHGNEWTGAELAALSDTEKPDVVLALELGRTWMAVVAKRNSLGIHRGLPPIKKRNITSWAIQFPKTHKAIEEYFVKLSAPIAEERWELDDSEIAEQEQRPYRKQVPV